MLGFHLPRRKCESNYAPTYIQECKSELGPYQFTCIGSNGLHVLRSDESEGVLSMINHLLQLVQ